MARIITYILILLNYCQGQSLDKFTNGDVNIYYEVRGRGPALYILQGGPGESPEHPGYRLMDSLSSSYTVVLMHQRGSGKSRNIPINENTISIKKYTEDIELLRQHRKDKNIIVLGMSWGGLLAMNYAAHYPLYVSRLLLICSAPPSYTLWNQLYDNQYVRRSRAELDSMDALATVFSVKSEKELDSIKRADPKAKEVLAYKEFLGIHVRAMYYDRNKAHIGFDELFYSFNFQPIPIIDKEVMETKWDITATLKKINTPALILYGRQDDQGESVFYLQKECLRNSTMQVIEQCGHMIWDDQPEQFYKAVLGYLDK